MTRVNAESLVKLIEEMIDLKLQQHAQANLKANPEITRILEEKRVTDRRRLEQIRAELVRLLGGCTDGSAPRCSRLPWPWCGVPTSYTNGQSEQESHEAGNRT